MTQRNWITQIRYLFGRPAEQSKAVGAFDCDDFTARERYRPAYATLCAHLLAAMPFETVLDLGCANGFLLAPMNAAGKRVRGIEISPDAISFLPEPLRALVTIQDATRVGKLGDFDLVTCVEVAEHVPPERTEGLLDAITANAARWVYFTAASPYQTGRGHINLRSHFHYLNEFRKRGFELDYDRTEELANSLANLESVKWLHFNSFIFRRMLTTSSSERSKCATTVSELAEASCNE